MLNIKVRARHLVEKYGTGDPFHLANDLRMHVLYAPLPDSIRGFLVHVLRRKIIILNDSLCYEAQKITVCHEIGHARLHNGYGYYLHADSAYYIPCRREQEANEYAIHLLSYSSDIDSDAISRIITEKHPDPRAVHALLGQLIFLGSDGLKNF